MTAFAIWLRARLTEKQMSSSRAAQLMSVSATTLGSWRAGVYQPPLAKIRIVAWALDVSELEVYCAIADVSDADLRAELARRGGER